MAKILIHITRNIDRNINRSYSYHTRLIFCESPSSNRSLLLREIPIQLAMLTGNITLWRRMRHDSH